MRALASVLAVTCLAALAGCSAPSSDGPAVTLEKRSVLCDSGLVGAPAGDECWQDVARVYGYADDWEGCEDIREALQLRPHSELALYRCIPEK